MRLRLPIIRAKTLMDSMIMWWKLRAQRQCKSNLIHLGEFVDLAHGILHMFWKSNRFFSDFVLTVCTVGFV